MNTDRLSNELTTEQQAQTKEALRQDVDTVELKAEEELEQRVAPYYVVTLTNAQISGYSLS
jgi:hypothetical protein